MMAAFEVKLTGKQTLAAFEGTLATLYRKSHGESEVVFDIRELEWIGHLPATLFFAWVATLSEGKATKRVAIRLPERADLTPQVHKALVEYGIIRALEMGGVEVPYSSSPEPAIGLPFAVVKSRGTLWNTIKNDSSRLLKATELSEAAREVVKDAFEIVLVELAENAFVHTNGSHPHYQVTVAKSSGRTSSYRGVISVFDEGVSYVEINLGNLGPGIEYSVDHKAPTKSYE